MKQLRFILLLFFSVPYIFSNSVLAQASGNATGTLVPNDTVVRFKTTLDNVLLCPDKKEVYLYIDLKGCSLGTRVPLNISVVFDRSGSMEGERIHYGKLAVDYLIDHLDPQDNMSIVIYDHIAEVLHGSEPVANREQLKKKLQHIHPRGHTNISGGLDLGYAEVKSTYDPKKINRVFLMSDGIPNEGITDPYLLERMVKSCSTKSNISLSAFGLGHEFDEVLMHDLAEAGGGHYYYIESPQDASRELVSEVKTLLSVVAQNANLAVEFPSDYLELARVYGQHSSVVGNMVLIDLKEVHPNETNGILLKFKVKQYPDRPLEFNSSLVYDNAITNMRTIQRSTNILKYSTSMDTCNKSANDKVVEKIIYFASNDLLEDAMKDADRNNIQSAKSKLNAGKKMIQSKDKSAQSTLLNSQYKALDDYDKHLDNWSTKSEEDIKRLHKKTRHQNYKLRKMKDN
ncbi:MAG TPA: VWA domain-containing protein [Cytophagaceae bacterium]|nr:VWA domain-containing protein [Cytophagaceae bacterium]